MGLKVANLQQLLPMLLPFDDRFADVEDKPLHLDPILADPQPLQQTNQHLGHLEASKRGHQPMQMGQEDAAPTYGRKKTL